jgi:hypothetical protein
MAVGIVTLLYTLVTVAYVCYYFLDPKKVELIFIVRCMFLRRTCRLRPRSGQQLRA